MRTIAIGMLLLAAAYSTAGAAEPLVVSFDVVVKDFTKSMPAQDKERLANTILDELEKNKQFSEKAPGRPALVAELTIFADPNPPKKENPCDIHIALAIWDATTDRLIAATIGYSCIRNEFDKLADLLINEVIPSKPWREGSESNTVSRFVTSIQFGRSEEGGVYAVADSKAKVLPFAVFMRPQGTQKLAVCLEYDSHFYLTYKFERNLIKLFDENGWAIVRGRNQANTVLEVSFAGTSGITNSTLGKVTTNSYDARLRLLSAKNPKTILAEITAGGSTPSSVRMGAARNEAFKGLAAELEKKMPQLIAALRKFADGS